MSNQHLMSAFEGDDEWRDDREAPQSQGWSLLNLLSRQKPAAPGAGTGTDAVFGNLLAKQEAPSEALPTDDETPPAEEPPTYQEAANDNAPSYWETTIMAPGWYDDVLVDELPVGSTLQLVWNLLFSFAFGIGGFIGTYLVHTSHASRTGSVLGLALTLLQSSYEARHGETHSPHHRDPNEFRPDNPNSYDDVPIQTGTFHQGLQQPDAPHPDPSGPSTWYWLNLAFAAILIWWSLASYIRVYRIKRAVLRETENGSESDETEHNHGTVDLESAPSSSLPPQPPNAFPGRVQEPTESAPDYDTPSH